MANNTSYTTGERLARIETTLEHTREQSERNGQRSEEILTLVLDKIDRLDNKIENRFNKIEEHALQDAKDLAALKNRGAGLLAGLGLIFTATATIFSDFFSAVKHAIFG
jgi:Asp-tRNA(Asn)/Glu-tRNA(Gln) amidotransferase A subunit family amidase